jgi:hypothetical protein
VPELVLYASVTVSNFFLDEAQFWTSAIFITFRWDCSNLYVLYSNRFSLHRAVPLAPEFPYQVPLRFMPRLCSDPSCRIPGPVSIRGSRSMILNESGRRWRAVFEYGSPANFRYATSLRYIGCSCIYRRRNFLSSISEGFRIIAEEESVAVSCLEVEIQYQT